MYPIINDAPWSKSYPEEQAQRYYKGGEPAKQQAVQMTDMEVRIEYGWYTQRLRRMPTYIWLQMQERHLRPLV